jgi:hypothetical protein
METLDPMPEREPPPAPSRPDETTATPTPAPTSAAAPELVAALAAAGWQPHATPWLFHELWVDLQAALAGLTYVCLSLRHAGGYRRAELLLCPTGLAALRAYLARLE